MAGPKGWFDFEGVGWFDAEEGAGWFDPEAGDVDDGIVGGDGAFAATSSFAGVGESVAEGVGAFAATSTFAGQGENGAAIPIPNAVVVRTVYAYAWVIDGIPTIFVTDEGLDADWADASGFMTTHAGLQFPAGLGCGIDLRSGLLTDDTATLTVDDVDGTLAELFRSARADATPLITTIEPGDVGPVAVRSRHVGTEFIGPAGERRQYSCVPGFAVGLKHYGQNEAFALSLGSTQVSMQPLLWAGRRCAVYRVARVGGVWQPLADAKRVWWGTLRGQGGYRRGTWSFSAYGPQAWASGNLGRGLFDDPITVLPVTEVGEFTYLFSSLTIYAPTSGTIFYDYGDMVDGTYLVGVAGYDNVAAAVNSFLADVIADNTLGNEFDLYGNSIRFSKDKGNDGILVQWKRGDTTSIGDPHVDSGDTQNLSARLRLTAHENVWRILGYDVRLQVGGPDGRDPVDNEDQYGRFEPVGTDGYYAGEFWSANAKAMLDVEKGEFTGDAGIDDYANHGSERRWPPLYPGGAVTFTGEPGQEFELDTLEPVLLAGSASRPLPADPDDDSIPYSLGGGVGDVTAQALLVLEGPYRRQGDGDQVDPVDGYAFQIEKERRLGKTVQVVRVAYRQSSDGTVSTGTGDLPRFVVVQWYPPRLFGFDFSPLPGTWGAFRDPPPDSETITARPLVALGDARDAGDKISEVIRRVLTTTGTVGEWYADSGLTVPLYGGDGWPAYLDVGANDDGGQVPSDAEDATLGLGVPSSMVQGPAHFAAVEDAAIGPDLRRCKVAAIGVLSAREMFARLLAPTGIGLSLAGGKYGVIDCWALPSPGDSVLTITPELYAGQAGKPDSSQATQSLRKWSAIDKLDVKARIDPGTRDYAVTLTRSATDGGAVYRQHEQSKHSIVADYVLDQRLAGVLGTSWLGDFGTRWRRGFEFWAEDNSEVVVKLHAADGLDTWPGDAVLLSDPTLLSGSGDYGISVAPGRVLGRVFDAERETVTLRILVASEANFRLYGPAALVTRYVENEGGVGYRLELEDDYFGDRVGTLDVDGFAEPDWSTEGGNALIEVFQFDGSTWTSGIFGEVTSVNAVAGACRIQLAGALTGNTFYRDRWSIVVLRDWADQTAAWVLRWLAPITLDDGTADGGPGEKFNGL